jgi:hypothetical protein
MVGELTGSGPFNRVAHFPARAVSHHDVHDRVRIPEVKLCQLSLDHDDFILVVHPRDGVMGGCLSGKHSDGDGDQRYERPLHGILDVILDKVPFEFT